MRDGDSTVAAEISDRKRPDKTRGAHSCIAYVPPLTLTLPAAAIPLHLSKHPAGQSAFGGTPPALISMRFSGRYHQNCKCMQRAVRGNSMGRTQMTKYLFPPAALKLQIRRPN